MKAEILTIGDELLRGEIVDSNKSHLSERLLSLDIETHWHASVRDDPPAMIDAFRRAAERADVVLVSGGLGPTRDDLTSQVLAESFGRKLVLDEAALETIRAFFRSVGREMTENNASQAHFPDGAEVLANPIGTAPGFVLEIVDTPIFCMPGVPRELYRMMDEQVLPRLEARADRKGQIVRARLLRTFGMGESTLDAELHDVAAGGDVSLGFRTAFPDNYLRPLARGATAEEAEAKLDRVCAVIRERLGELVYGEGDETMEEVTGRAAGRARRHRRGGRVLHRRADRPEDHRRAGSSAYFLGGVVAYANEAKTALLGVPEAMLAEHGAVSDPVARAMAEGVRERFGASIGVADDRHLRPRRRHGREAGRSRARGTGPARPAPTPTHFVFPLDRHRHRMLTAQIALDWMRRHLLGAPLEGPTLLRRRGGASVPGQGKG